MLKEIPNNVETCREMEKRGSWNKSITKVKLLATFSVSWQERPEWTTCLRYLVTFSGEQVFSTQDNAMSGAPKADISLTTSGSYQTVSPRKKDPVFIYQQPRAQHVSSSICVSLPPVLSIPLNFPLTSLHWSIFIFLAPCLQIIFTLSLQYDD